MKALRLIFLKFKVVRVISLRSRRKVECKRILPKTVSVHFTVASTKTKALNILFPLQTNIGTVLVSINPHKKLPLYTPDVIDIYRCHCLYELPPHM